MFRKVVIETACTPSLPTNACPPSMTDIKEKRLRLMKTNSKGAKAILCVFFYVFNVSNEQYENLVECLLNTFWTIFSE